MLNFRTANQRRFNYKIPKFTKHRIRECQMSERQIRKRLELLNLENFPLIHLNLINTNIDWDTRSVYSRRYVNVHMRLSLYIIQKA
jgi:hypothetical protein